VFNVMRFTDWQKTWIARLAFLAVLALLIWVIFGLRGTLMLVPALVVLIISFFWGQKSRLHANRLASGLCVVCGYSLRGNETMICPECGEPYEKRRSMRMVRSDQRR